MTQFYADVHCTLNIVGGHTAYLALSGIFANIQMAPTRRLSTLRALEVSTTNTKSNTLLGHEVGIFLTDLHHTLNVRSCNHFQIICLSFRLKFSSFLNFEKYLFSKIK